ncbi:hypothetical protein RugamoR64_13570 [Duganella rhizosphaerae]|uniref:hypothetical protein n=1 Tax=Duganella rhizosphaerae TaxID=2885763 RepID=UPI0030EA31EB
MNMIRNTTIALFILTLAACASDRSSEPGTSTGTSSYPSDGSSPSTTSTTSGTSQSGSANQSSTTGTMTSSSPSAQTSYGVVQAIDQMQRQDAGVGMAGAAAAGGSVGLPTDKVYRVTVRMDDGSTQMVVVDSMPSYKTGDRVRYNNGSLTSY